MLYDKRRWIIGIYLLFIFAYISDSEVYITSVLAGSQSFLTLVLWMFSFVLLLYSAFTVTNVIFGLVYLVRVKTYSPKLVINVGTTLVLSLCNTAIAMMICQYCINTV